MYYISKSPISVPGAAEVVGVVGKVVGKAVVGVAVVGDSVVGDSVVGDFVSAEPHRVDLSFSSC